MTLLHPWALLLLPIATIPFLLKRNQGQVYSWLAMVPEDKASDIANFLIKVISALILISLVGALASPMGAPKKIVKVGKGAQTVFVIDRSVSMDQPFAGSINGHVAEIKSAATRRLITKFIDARPDDMMGVVGFSNFALYGIKITTRRDAIHSAIDAATSPAINQTNIGAGLIQGISLFDNIQNSGSRALILLSDGGGKLSAAVKARIQALLASRNLNLYWIVIREPNDVSIFTDNTYSEDEAPDAVALDKYFKSINVKYKAFEADNPSTLQSALEDIDSKEKNIIQYSVYKPAHDYSTNLITLAFILSLLILIIKNLRVYSW